MKKKTRAFLKQSLAVLLSFVMASGPCAPGISPVFAARSGNETVATSSDAEWYPGPAAAGAAAAGTALAGPAAAGTAAAGTALAGTASDSDALFDEDGYLLDGTVKNDAGVNAEERTAEERTTEGLAAEGLADKERTAEGLADKELADKERTAEELTSEEPADEEFFLADGPVLATSSVAAMKDAVLAAESYQVTFDYGKKVAYEEDGAFYYYSSEGYVDTADSLEEALELASQTVVCEVVPGESIQLDIPFLSLPKELDGQVQKMKAWVSEGGERLYWFEVPDYVPEGDIVFEAEWYSDFYAVTFDYDGKIVFEEEGRYFYLLETGGTGAAKTFEEALERSSTYQTYYAEKGKSLQRYTLYFNDPVFITDQIRNISGWISDSGETLGTRGSYNYVPTKDIVFEAQWVTDFYTVTFDYGGRVVYEDNGWFFYVLPGGGIGQEATYDKALSKASWTQTYYVEKGEMLKHYPLYFEEPVKIDGVLTKISCWTGDNGDTLEGSTAPYYYVPTEDVTFEAEWLDELCEITIDYGTKMFYQDALGGYMYLGPGSWHNAPDRETAEANAVDNQCYNYPTGDNFSLQNPRGLILKDGILQRIIGYREDDGTILAPGVRTTVERAMHFTAVWSEGLTLTLHENNGLANEQTCVMHTSSAEDVILPVGTGKLWDGYEFENGAKLIYGWSTDKNQVFSEPQYGAVLRPTQNMDLYAIWGSGCTITLDPAGGEVDEEQVIVLPGQRFMPGSAYKYGSVFDAWYDKASGERILRNGFVPEGDMELIAHYSGDGTLRFVDNYHGSEEYETWGFRTGWEIQAYNNYFEHPGAVFLGYSTDRNAAEPEIPEDGYFYPVDGMTLYGVWADGRTLTVDLTEGEFLNYAWSYEGVDEELECLAGDNILARVDAWIAENELSLIHEERIFDCWCYDYDGRRPVKADDVITKDTVIYARWKQGHTVFMEAGDAGVWFYRPDRGTSDARNRLTYTVKPGESLTDPGIVLDSDVPVALAGYEVSGLWTGAAGGTGASGRAAGGTGASGGTVLETLDGIVPESDLLIRPVMQTDDIVRVTFHAPKGGEMIADGLKGIAFYPASTQEIYVYVPRGTCLNPYLIPGAEFPEYDELLRGWTDSPAGGTALELSSFVFDEDTDLYPVGKDHVFVGLQLADKTDREIGHDIPEECIFDEDWPDGFIEVLMPEGEPMTYPSDSAMKNGDLHFAGWYRNSDFTGEAVRIPDSGVVPENGMILYAKWTDGIPVESVKINTAARTIPVGGTFQLKAWPQPVEASDRSVTWVSADPSVAAVDDTGLVTAVSAGTAVVTVTTVDGGFTADCTITVTVPVTDVKINVTSGEKTMIPGATFQMKAWPQPSNASDRSVVWSSDDPSVATVSETGLVTAVSAGTAVVTVTTVDGGFTADCTITVRVPVTGVKINVTSGEKTIDVGKTFQMAAWPQPSNATNKAVTWSSSNPSVATVSGTGLVTGIAAGTAVVTVTTADGGKTAACKFTVKTPTIAVTSVKINTTAKTITAGGEFQLAAWPQPTNATNKAVTWSSSNSAVAKVSSSGLVTAVKAGTAVITVKTVDGGYAAACNVTVKAATVAVTSVKINTTAKTITAGGTFQLAAWPQPTNATNKTVIWSSSNSAVASVSSAGVVKGVKAGTAVITVKTVDGGFTATCKVTVKAATVAVTGVKINTTVKTLSVGGTFQLAAWPQPTNATNKKVTWSSSNSAVASVSSTGVVKGVKAGTATITVKTVDGGKTATCKITVSK